MRVAATIRKASAYLTSFDAPPPANDLQDSRLPVMPQTEEPSPASANQSGTDNDADSAAEIADQLSPDAPAAEDVTAAFDVKIAAAVEIERQAAEQRLRQAREDWTDEIADRLATRLDQEVAGAINSFREDIAAILSPFVSHAVVARSLEVLTDVVRKGLAGVANPCIEISAPVDVIEKLSRALADRDIAIVAREADHADVAIHLGSTTIATALEALRIELSSGLRDQR